MIKALVRTVLLVVFVLVLAQFVPFVAQHEYALVAVAVALGLIGVITRVLVIMLLIAAVALFFFHFA